MSGVQLVYLSIFGCWWGEHICGEKVGEEYNDIRDSYRDCVKDAKRGGAGGRVKGWERVGVYFDKRVTPVRDF